jgi:glycerophosphoryl diester phosphodiesterase
MAGEYKAVAWPPHSERDTAPFFNTLRFVRGFEERVVPLGCIALDLEHRLLTKARIDEIHDAGLRLATWTVNDPARAAELIGWGVDMLITDAVDVISPR